MEAKRIAHATNQLFAILLSEDSPTRIVDSLARIVGETLEIDRSLIYDVSFTTDEATCLTEWLNPERPEITSTNATYPLALFRQAATHLFETQAHLESHAVRPDPVMVADGTAPLLHGEMQIASLLWYPFAFREDGFYLFAFNHVTVHHPWTVDEVEFMRTATHHVNMALVKIGLLRERARVEEVLFEAQRVESLGLLAGGIAHDFNNLMVGVVSNSELLARRLPPESPHLEVIAQILHSGRRASALAEQLLAYAGQTQPKATVTDLAELVRGTIQLVQSSMGGVRVELDVTDRPVVECNTSQLEQVVMNLLVNAGEAMSARSEPVRVSVAQTEVDARRGATYDTPGRLVPGPYAVIEVADVGAGMTAATVKRIFDPFFSTKRPGRGLGLSAVLGIVRRNGGAIRITSEVARGTTFQILWPRSDAQPVVVSPPVETARTAARMRRLLCIDDDVMVLSSVSTMLVDSGFEVVSANGGALGIALFEKQAAHVDGVLLDLTMPHPSGATVLRQLRALRPDLPVILMSGFTTDLTMLGPLDAHTRFIRKPFGASDMLPVVASVLSRGVAT